MTHNSHCEPAAFRELDLVRKNPVCNGTSHQNAVWATSWCESLRILQLLEHRSPLLLADSVMNCERPLNAAGHSVPHVTFRPLVGSLLRGTGEAETDVMLFRFFWASNRSNGERFGTNI